MPFDIIAARKEASDTEIADYLAAKANFDVQGARKSGASDTEIADYLSDKMKTSPLAGDASKPAKAELPTGMQGYSGQYAPQGETKVSLIGGKPRFGITEPVTKPEPLGVRALRTAEVLGAGVGKGMAGMAGLPVDIANAALGIVGLDSEKPVLGSKFIQENILPEPVKPTDTVERIAGAIGEQVGANAIPLGAGLGYVRVTGKVATPIIQAIVGNLKAMPISKILQFEAAIAGGAGTASGLVRGVTDNPYADAAAQLVGGLGAAGAMGAIKAIKNKIMTSVKEPSILPIVRHGMAKGIRPSVSSTGISAPQNKLFYDKAAKGVETIIDNKLNLEFVRNDEMITGNLPENLSEFSQAIHQTKTSIFREYNALAKAAGKEGATIDLSSVAKELEIVTQNKVLNKMAPNTVKYAEARMGHMTGRFTPEEAQEAITVLNNSLNAFYKNPTYEAASNAEIDALIANKLRQTLDDVIEKTGGVGYQELKNTYGALKTIEKDVARRVNTDARKAIKGLIDFSDIGSGAMLTHGLLTLQPATIGAGITVKALAAYHKLINNPNRIVRNMFSESEKTLNASSGLMAKAFLFIRKKMESGKSLTPLEQTTVDVVEKNILRGLPEGQKAQTLKALPEGQVAAIYGPDAEWVIRTKTIRRPLGGIRQAEPSGEYGISASPAQEPQIKGIRKGDIILRSKLQPSSAYVPQEGRPTEFLSGLARHNKKLIETSKLLESAQKSQTTQTSILDEAQRAVTGKISSRELTIQEKRMLQKQLKALRGR